MLHDEDEEEEEEEEDEEAVTEVEQGEAKLIDLGDEKEDKKPTLTKQAPLAQPDDL